jgi:hypothetical protein
MTICLISRPRIFFGIKHTKELTLLKDDLVVLYGYSIGLGWIDIFIGNIHGSVELKQ